jgi:hypothetical protein
MRNFFKRYALPIIAGLIPLMVGLFHEFPEYMASAFVLIPTIFILVSDYFQTRKQLKKKVETILNTPPSFEWNHVNEWKRWKKTLDSKKHDENIVRTIMIKHFNAMTPAEQKEVAEIYFRE